MHPLLMEGRPKRPRAWWECHSLRDLNVTNKQPWKIYNRAGSSSLDLSFFLMPCLLGMLENIWLPKHSVKTNHLCPTLHPCFLLYFCVAFRRLNLGTNQIWNLTCAGQRGLYLPTERPRLKRVKVPVLIQVHCRPPWPILSTKTTYLDPQARKVSNL